LQAPHLDSVLTCSLDVSETAAGVGYRYRNSSLVRAGLYSFRKAIHVTIATTDKTLM
jgi:hypothetical protein